MLEDNKKLLVYGKPSDYLVVFLSFAFVLPALIISYSVCQWLKRFWIRYAKWRHPGFIIVEESTTRSILDQGRNQGIYTFLVETSIPTSAVQTHLSRLSAVKPLLRLALKTRCWFYAWDKSTEFQLENHFIISPNIFQGRPVTVHNLQKYVSDLTTKFLPPGQSPWQIHLIVCRHQSRSRERRYYLIRVHHQLLTDEKLHIGDFLPLGTTDPATWGMSSGKRTNSPFTTLYQEPTALPKLWEKLTESFSNSWNDFVSRNDPLERPEMLKKPFGLYQCFKVAIIVVFSTCKEVTRKYRKKEGSLDLTTIFGVFDREVYRRYLGWGVVTRAVFNCFNPSVIIKSLLFGLLWVLVLVTTKIPLIFLKECRALVFLPQDNFFFYSDTYVYVMSSYLPLLFKATLELVKFLGIILTGPLALFDILIRVHQPWNARLQTFSHSGRKVVAWSKEVEVQELQRMSTISGLSQIEILLAGVSDSLKEYFRYTGHEVPTECLCSAKTISQKALCGHEKENKGLICFSLPVRTKTYNDDFQGLLQAVHHNICEARLKQQAVYAVTRSPMLSRMLISCMPSVFLKIILNHLTSRYSIFLTHVDGVLPVNEIKSAIYWKPPQGNSCFAITLHKHGDSYRLGLMADAMVGPQFSIITRTFPMSIKNIAKSIYEPNVLSRSPSPSTSATIE